MQLGDLTTMTRVKQWIGLDKFTGTNSDFVLGMLISNKSRDICTWLERPYILPKVYTNEQYDGLGNVSQFLRYWPVVSISSLYVSGQVIPALPSLPGQPDSGFGYRYEQWNGIPPGSPQLVSIIGGRFSCGSQNILVSYNAGYQVTGEAWAIPSTAQPTVTVLQPYGICLTDQGVVDVSTQVAFTSEAYNTNQPPSLAGHYQVIPPDTQIGNPAVGAPPGQYLFSPADRGRAVKISYGYVPSALEQVIIELIAERFMYRSHIGEDSRTINGQVTTKYNVSDVPMYAKGTLQLFKHSIPV